jgi:hypothetical protein
MWVLTLSLLPRNVNKRERVHWGVNRRELEAITNEIGWLAKAQRIPAATGKRSVRVTIHKTLRSRVTDDPGNIDSRAKSILDALVRLGLLQNDDARNLDWHGVIEGERRKQKQTIIEIWDTNERAAA